ncbi:class I SAM-dependent methyltransferase [Arcobacter sp. KX21116]|uniref:class I SAM-dependent methyltransferase n=1 Tax=Arcobacter iocasae TaxID=2906515 RepID=UPI0035D42FA8
MSKIDGDAVNLGLDCSSDYAINYANSHNKRDFTYNFEYMKEFAIDILIPNYSILDVGCGTAGYYKYIKNCEHLVCLDGSKNMLNEAKKLSKEFDIKRIDYECCLFDDYNSSLKFDIVSLGVYGHYLPHNITTLIKVSSLLKDEGVAVFNISIPTSLYTKVGVIVKNIFTMGKSKTISEIKFEKMLKKADIGNVIAKLHRMPNRISYFVKK